MKTDKMSPKTRSPPPPCSDLDYIYIGIDSELATLHNKEPRPPLPLGWHHHPTIKHFCNTIVNRTTAPLHAQIESLTRKTEELTEQVTKLESLLDCRRTTSDSPSDAMSTSGDTSSTASDDGTNTASTPKHDEILNEDPFQEVQSKRRRKKTPQVSPSKFLPPPNDPHQPPPTQPREKIPPIFLRDPSVWTEISDLMETSNIPNNNTKQVGDAIRIQLPDSGSYRALHKLLDTKNIPYHSFLLPEEKPVRAVIRGIPVQIETAAVLKDIARQGFNPVRVTRMCNLRTKKPMPLLFVVLRNGEDKFLSLTKIVGLDVKIELPHKRSSISQCHNCQGFHHTQVRCSVPPRCVKCAGEHSTHDCQKPAEEPPKCLHCSGAHPANYKGCPKFPTSRKPKKPVSRKAAPPPPPISTESPTLQSHEHPGASPPQPVPQSTHSYAKALRTSPPSISVKDIVSQMAKLLAEFTARLENPQ